MKLKTMMMSIIIMVGTKAIAVIDADNGIDYEIIGRKCDDGGDDDGDDDANSGAADDDDDDDDDDGHDGDEEEDSCFNTLF